MAALWAVSDAPLHRKVSDASMAAAAKFVFSCLLLRASAAAAEARGRGAEIDPGDFGIQIKMRPSNWAQRKCPQREQRESSIYGIFGP